jgi:hypothetical protein
MSQIIDIGGIRDRAQQCILGIWWKDQRFEYDGANLLIYKGSHPDHDADITDENWAVSKFTYDGDNVVRIEGPLIGSWDGRALLAWGV